jgi:hypothetical protein
VRPHLEPLEDRTLLNAALATFVNSKLDTLRTGLASVVTTAANIPIINSPLSSIAEDVAGSKQNGPPSDFQIFQTMINPILKALDPNASEQALQQQFYAAMDKSGLLRDLNGNGTTDDRALTKNAATGDITIVMNVGYSANGSRFQFAPGLPGLPLNFTKTNTVQTTVGFICTGLTFGMHADGSPLPNVTANQLQVTLGAGVPGIAMQGSLGFMQIRASDSGSNLQLTLTTDVTPAGLVNPRLNGEAVISLDLTASFSGNNPQQSSPGGNYYQYPYIATTFYVDWRFNNADPKANLASFGDDPTVEFRNVTFGVGAFLGNVLRPVVETVQTVLKPLNPILDILTTEIPGLSDISKDAGLGPTSLSSLAQLISPILPPDYQLYVTLAVTLGQLHTLMNSLNTSDPNAYTLNVGTLSLAGSNIRSKTAINFNDPNLFSTPNLTNLIPVAVNAVNNVKDKIESALPSSVGQVFSFIDDALKRAENGAGFDFPLLQDPVSGVFKLLLGQDVDFVNFHFQFHLSASETKLIPIADPAVYARFSGAIDSDVYFKIGYDTKGLRDFLTSIAHKADAAQLAHGFYIDTTKNLLRMSGSISAGLAVEVPLPTVTVPVPDPFVPGTVVPVPVTVDASINGSVTADDIEVRFGNADSKLRFFESLPSPLFLTKGTVTAGFDFLVEAGVPGVYTKTLYDNPFAETTLLDLYNGPLADPDNPITSTPSQPVPAPVNIDLSSYPVLHFPNSPVARPYLVNISVRGNTAYFTINGSPYPAVPSKPLGAISNVQVIGSDGPDYLTVSGSLNKPVKFVSTLLDRVTLDDQSAGTVVSAQYTVLAGELKRAGLDIKNGFGNSIVDVKFDTVNYITLKTSNGANTIQISSLYNTGATLMLGTAANVVTVDTTFGGFSDNLSIQGKTLANTGFNSLAIIDKDPALDLQSGPATYALTTIYNGAAITDTSIVRTKRQVVPLGKRLLTATYTATTAIHYSGIDTVSIKGGDMGNEFDVRGINPATKYTLTGGATTDTFVLGAVFAKLGFVAGAVTLDGGGGRDDQLVLDDSGDDRVTYQPQTTYTISTRSIAVQSQVALQGTPVNVNGTYKFQNVEHFLLKAGGGNVFSVNDTPTVFNLDPKLHIDGDMTILGGKDNNQVSVFGTTGLLTVDAGATGFNQIVVGGAVGQPAGTLNRVRAAVTLKGTGSFYINDAASTLPYTYVMDATRLSRLDSAGNAAGGAITYQGITAGSLSILGGSGGNTFRIGDTPAISSSSVAVSSGTGSDTVLATGVTGDVSIDLQSGLNQTIRIGDSSHSLDNIRGKLTVTGGDTVAAVVSDEASTTPHVTTISTSKLGSEKIERRDQGQSVPRTTLVFGLFGAVLANLTYVDGQASDNVAVEGSPAGSPISVYGNPACLDEFGISAYTDAIKGPVTFFGQANSDYAVYYDYFNANPQTYTFKAGGIFGTGEEVDRSGLAPVIFNNTSEIILYSASDRYLTDPTAHNAVNVLSVPAHVYLNLAPSGRDRVTVGSKAPNLGGSLAGIKGPVTVVGTQQTTLTLDNSGDTGTTPRRVTLGPSTTPYSPGNQIVGLTGDLIYWNLDTTSSLTILGGAANETYAVAGTSFLPAIHIDGGGGVNTLDYSSYNGLPGLVAWYPGEGDANDVIAGNNGTLHGGVTFVAGKVGQAFSFNGVDSYVQAVNSFALESPTVSVEAWVNSSAVDRDSYILAQGASGGVAASYALYTGLDRGLRFYVFDGTTYIESPDAGTGIWDGNWHHVVGTYDGANVRLYVDGVEIGGGTPTNLLINYSLPDSSDFFIGTYNAKTNTNFDFNGLIDEPSVYNRALSAAEVQALFDADSTGKLAAAVGVYVNLQTGTATELAGGVASIQKVTGSDFNDILVGKGGNVLDGNGGRDLLIAGSAAGTLIGGDGEDILIGGTTDYDQDTAALAAILAAWTDPNLDYATRVANLSAGTGVPVLNATTAHANGGGNTLTGGAGLDLFLGDLAKDSTDRDLQTETLVSI